MITNTINYKIAKPCSYFGYDNTSTKDLLIRYSNDYRFIATPLNIKDKINSGNKGTANDTTKTIKDIKMDSKDKAVKTDINGMITFIVVLANCVKIACKSIAGIVNAKDGQNKYDIPTAHTADIIQGMFGNGHKQVIAVLHYVFNAVTGRQALSKASIQYCLYMGVANYRYAKAQDNVHTSDATHNIDRTCKDAVTGLTSDSKRHNKWASNTVKRIDNQLTQKQLIYAINAYTKAYGINADKFKKDLLAGCKKSKLDNAKTIVSLLNKKSA